MSRKPTSKQVAELAGVSQTTVSFVLNNVEGANISQETRERVLQAARDLQYVPDIAARTLARGRSNNIALILGRPHRQIFIDEYIPTILTGLTEVTQPEGYRLFVEMFGEMTFPRPYEDLIRGKEVAGVIVNINSTMVRDVEALLSHTREQFPVVTLEEVHPDFYSVTVDKLGGTRTIVEHLIHLGHRRIACITYGPLTELHPADRLKVFREVVENAGGNFDWRLVREGAYDPDTGYAAMKSLLQSGEKFTAVYAMNDTMAFGALAAIHEAGLRVPDDLAVVGFDDIRLTRFSNPPLTTIREPDIEHGRRAAEMLISLIHGIEPAEKHVLLGTELIVRESCGALPPQSNGRKL